MPKISGRILDATLYGVGLAISVSAPLIVLVLGWTGFQTLSRRYGDALS